MEPLVRPVTNTGDVVRPAEIQLLALASHAASVESVQYSPSVIGEPPLDPNVNETETDRSRADKTDTVGALGVVAGVLQTSEDAAPLPTEFTARTCTQYSVPFVNDVVPSEESFVTRSDVAVVSESVRACHVAPRSVEYW